MQNFGSLFFLKQIFSIPTDPLEIQMEKNIFFFFFFYLKEICQIVSQYVILILGKQDIAILM